MTHQRTINSKRFSEKGLRIGVVGLGYVGLPLALLFAKTGFQVTGFDVNQERVTRLELGGSYITHVSEADLTEVKATFEATAVFDRLVDMDVIIICVPTPIDKHCVPDLTSLRIAARAVSEHLRTGQLVILESTSFPGTTEEVLLPILRESGIDCSVDRVSPPRGASKRQGTPGSFFLAFCPEREDPGNTDFDLAAIPKIVSGVDSPSAQAALALYQQVFVSTFLVSSTRVAEMAKLLENIYRSVNIALVNETKILCLNMGIDIWEAIEAASTKPFGFQPFYPGPGVGGHCIPVDPFYLSWKAKEFNTATRFIELAGEINAAMPSYVVAATVRALGERGFPIVGARILLLGCAYKRDTDDTRGSPSIAILKALLGLGAIIEYSDPYVPLLTNVTQLNLSMTSVPLTAERLATYDAALITTDHSIYDYDFIVRCSRLVVDTRNATRDVSNHRERIVRC